MSKTTLTAHGDLLVAESVFRRVLVGVDGSEPGFRAVRQARRLVAPGGRLTLLTAVHLIEANLAAWSASRIETQLEQEAGRAMAEAVAIAGPHAVTRLVNGPPLPSLLDELKETDATLAVVGTHEHSRLSEIVTGGVVGELLHRAACSVCVARPAGTEAPFPGAIVAGCDGSPQSETAVSVARYLSARYDAPLTLVTAVGGTHVDLERTRALGAVEIEGHPVEALVEASLDADLLVVGSRSLHGIRALGSVSERVAHHAQCSVLVIRESGAETGAAQA